MQLLSELKQFGLNPQEWIPKIKSQGPENPYRVHLQNVEDSDLQLEGESVVTRKNGHLVLKWLNLRLFC